MVLIKREELKVLEYPDTILFEMFELGSPEYVEKWKQTCITYPDLDETIKYVLNTLTLRETRVVLARYKDKQTFSAIAKLEGVTLERIRQIIAKAIRRLRYKTRRRVVMIGITEYEKLREDVQLVKSNTFEFVGPINKYLEYTELSVRSYNCLRRAGCKTLKDVYEKSDTIYLTKNMGKKSLAEVIKIMKSYGYDTSVLESTYKEVYDENVYQM